MKVKLTGPNISYYFLCRKNTYGFESSNLNSPPYILGFQQEEGEETHKVALHSYQSANPEDLNFKEGDEITVLARSINRLSHNNNLFKPF